MPSVKDFENACPPSSKGRYKYMCHEYKDPNSSGELIARIFPYNNNNNSYTALYPVKFASSQRCRVLSCAVVSEMTGSFQPVN